MLTYRLLTIHIILTIVTRGKNVILRLGSNKNVKETNYYEMSINYFEHTLPEMNKIVYVKVKRLQKFVNFVIAFKSKKYKTSNR
jgi:hypothetical protein